MKWFLAIVMVLSIIVHAAAPKSPTARLNAVNGMTGVMVTVDPTASTTPNGTSWSGGSLSWGDGAMDVWQGAPTKRTHTYASAGAYALHLTVKNNSKSATANSTATIQDPPPPPPPPPPPGGTTAASCELFDVQAAIDAAVDGDVVTVPAGSCTWLSNIGWDRKNITVKGAGAGLTNITTNGSFAFYVSEPDANKGQWRITGFTFTGTNSTAVIAVTSENFPGVVYGWRIDHNAFNFPDGERTGIAVRGVTYGVIDHNQFAPWNGGAAVLAAAFLSTECNTDNPSGNFSATQPLDLGTVNAIYMEDNTFTALNSPVTAYDTSAGGARAVFRHNVVTGGFYYSHWTRGCEIGGVLHEVYNNTFIGSTAYNDYSVRLEAGTGVIFNNTMQSYQSFPPYVFLDDRRADGVSQTTPPLNACDGHQAWDGNLGDPAAPGWPCLMQIGRAPGKSYAQIVAGDKQVSSPVYLWNNGVEVGCAIGGVCTDVAVVFGSPAAFIKSTPHPNGDVDYVVGSARPGYAPLVYPHPLVQ